ncbi:MAG: UDP-N-acetylmuramoyl-L-alanyl-D-glutamate--2,6-diaminopimelate ligase [Variibacter sp.]|nr:UDP-N-acetylmuramoyl-L-alanyl-D-glutamate--2,6-diaminopimelate ligase [Variibacter sp.]
MRLSQALPPDATFDPALADIDVSGITADSRTVSAGEIFVALAGSRTDGARFVADAIARGAAAIVAEHAMGSQSNVPVVQVPNARRVLALTAARFFPQQPDAIAAVTGTSGKTSVAAFLRQIWQRLGYAAASMGTVGVVAPQRETYGSLTTPDPVQLHRLLDELAREGVTHLAMEASSHGLHQHRIDGVHVSVAAFTNLSRDHMDYHADIQEYLQAKVRLFSEVVSSDGAAVVNADDCYAYSFTEAAKARKLRLLTVGRIGDDIQLTAAQPDGFAQRLTVEFGQREWTIMLPLVGAFQAENALVAAGMAIASGGDPDAVFSSLGKLKGAKGRLEFVGTHNDAPIFIDYAHKPDALAKTLEALRPYVKRRLRLVFGAGGDRDKGKRPLMGRIAAEGAEAVIVTDDNPRTERAADIRAQILAAAPGAREIGDRAEAIRTAIAALEPGDVLVIAGKGHETGQIVGDRTLPFSDHDAVAAALGEIAA